MSLDKIIKVTFAADPTPQPEDMSRNHVWVKFNKVSGSIPEKASITQKIMDLVGMLWQNPQSLEIELQPAAVSVMGVEVHHNQDNIGEVIRVFAVGYDFLIVHGVKVQIPVTLKGWILTPDLIDPGNEVFEAIGSVEIPML